MADPSPYLEELRNVFVQLMENPVERVENERLEIKGWCHDEKELTEKMVEATSCLANAKGGMVLIGIESKRPNFSPCPFRNVSVAWIEARIKDNTVPPVECEVYDASEGLKSVRGIGGQAPAKRNEWFSKQTDQKLTGAAERDLKAAATVDELMAALDRRIAKNVTADRVPKGALIFQPSAERRRSGSHYTPRSLTSPVVKATLEPVLAQLGTNPKPEQILALKVCDPAMGSGAFLVEACRHLGYALMEAWHTHKATPPLPPDEDELLHAQRLVAQRCLYGVDKNPMAVDLAKLSLWLATLARDHEFTFLNHSLRHGDSLLGLTARQIAAFHWDAPSGQSRSFFEGILREKIVKATNFRREILDARDDVNYEALSYSLSRADDQLEYPRIYGDLVLSAFFAGNNKARRKGELQRLAALGESGEEAQFRQITEAMRTGEKPLVPFHWEIEFPEVFQLDTNLHVRGGFDAVVGNPPFLGGTRISEELGESFFGWLTAMYPPAGHLCDLVGYFFRRAFKLLNQQGCFGLIATNTIGQGDTREGSLAPIINEHGAIYAVVHDLRWPGDAAVTVNIVHVSKHPLNVSPNLNGVAVPRISAFLVKGSVDQPPARLRGGPYFSSGSKIYGQGFLFDDGDPKANPMSVKAEILRCSPESAARILPYIGGEEVNGSPNHSPFRDVIYLSDLKTEDELLHWPMLAEVVRQKVKPERDVLGNNANNIPLKRRWWAYQAHRPELYSRTSRLSRVLVNSQVSEHLVFAFLPTGWIYAHRLNVFDLSSDQGFAVVQSRVHEIWARFFGSTLEDRLMYALSDCFETFAFPEDYETSPCLGIGRTYYDFRAALMIHNNEGLTKTYNRFHQPNVRSEDIKRLRELHDQMDRAVLDAYGWSDIRPVCEFFPEFEKDEEDESEARRPRTKKYRYRWPDEIHDEVLARLLALNQERAAQGR